MGLVMLRVPLVHTTLSSELKVGFMSFVVL